MSTFADRYIQKNIVYPAFISNDVSSSLAMIVMIPCLNEPEILRTLESLWNCEPIESYCEVIVVVNNSVTSSAEVKHFNLETYQNLMIWGEKYSHPKPILHPIYAGSVSSKHAGAGMARKIGMDEAIRRFNVITKPEGVIVSLDADCLVSANYYRAGSCYFGRRGSG